MRRLLRRRALTIIAVIISFTAIPAAGIVATATPALASVTICNSSGQFCLGAPTIDFGNPVVLTVGGRQVTEVYAGFTCCGGHEVFQIQFVADTTKCVGVVDNGTNVTVRACSGGNKSHVNWAEEPQSGGIIEWFSNTKDQFLASDDIQGHQLFTCAFCGGFDIAWNN